MYSSILIHYQIVNIKNLNMKYYKNNMKKQNDLRFIEIQTTQYDYALNTKSDGRRLK
jgi:hypothetical protein